MLPRKLGKPAQTFWKFRTDQVMYTWKGLVFYYSFQSKIPTKLMIPPLCVGIALYKSPSNDVFFVHVRYSNRASLKLFYIDKRSL